MNIWDDTPEGAPRIKTVRPKKPKTLRDKICRGRPYRDAHKDFKKQCFARRARCWLCNEPIRYDLREPHPLSFCIDHVIPVRDRPDLILEQTNWKPAHKRCNDSRGAGGAPLDMGIPSRQW
jgi:hypothetical protein